MSTGGEEKCVYSLVNVGTLTVENTNETPTYISIVICQDKLIVLNKDGKVKIHRLHDGKFLDMLDSDSSSCAICLLDATTICVLHRDGLIEMASIKSEDMSPVFTRMKSFRLHRVFDYCHSVLRVKDTIVVVGVKRMTYWYIVALDDRHVDTIHQICKWSGRSSVTTKDNIIYISCYAVDDDTGVYAFDILNPSQFKYKYKHERLNMPRSIIINEDGNIFVCNGSLDDSCIHQLTASCQLVAIFTQGIPWDLRAMFWDNERLYVACFGSRDITVFCHVYQDQNPEKDTSFAECIKESNFRKIGLLLKNRMVPSKRTIIHAIKEYGYNKGIQCLLIGISNILRKQIPDAIRVWSGYRTEDLHTPVFVVMFSKKTNIPENMTFLEPYDEYEIVFRNEHTPNNEEELISEQSKVNANTINNDDIARVLHCIAKNTDRLMNEHSNLSIIAASAVKSMGFNGCLSKCKLMEPMCIVLYVPLKGIIPVGEKEFPKDIDGISTDVREGEFVFHGRNTSHMFHQNVRMGCLISTKAEQSGTLGQSVQSGTLGGFVDLPDGQTGCITAAHVVLNEQQRKTYAKFKKTKKARYNASLAQGQTIIKVYQPTMQYGAFGRVSRIAFEEGNQSVPSVDAAVIEITNHDRTPCTGVFPSCNCYVPGVTNETPMMFNSGKTLDHSNISRETTVIKYGCCTAITLGTLQFDGASVRIANTTGKSWNRLKGRNISDPKFFNQMVVKSSDKRNFAKPGDSGALVFKYHTNITDLEAIGLLIGGSTHGSSARMDIVTPIQAVFEQLRLGNVMFKRFPDINQGEHN